MAQLFPVDVPDRDREERGLRGHHEDHHDLSRHRRPLCRLFRRHRPAPVPGHQPVHDLLHGVLWEGSPRRPLGALPRVGPVDRHGVPEERRRVHPLRPGPRVLLFRDRVHRPPPGQGGAVQGYSGEEIQVLRPVRGLQGEHGKPDAQPGRVVQSLHREDQRCGQEHDVPVPGALCLIRRDVLLYKRLFR